MTRKTRPSAARPRPACVHPLAALARSPVDPRLYCKLCRNVVDLPTSLAPRTPSRDLVQAVAAFLRLVTEAGDAGVQLNPRAELALILAMSDALHAIKVDDA